MSSRFDTLTFAKRMTGAGQTPEFAETLAMSIKELVMDEIATKADLRAQTADIQAVRTEVAGVRTEVQELRSEIGSLRTGLRGEIESLQTGLRGEIEAFRKEANERFATKDDLRYEAGLLRKDIDAMGLKLTVRMGGMVAVAVGAVATLNRIL